MKYSVKKKKKKEYFVKNNKKNIYDSLKSNLKGRLSFQLKIWVYYHSAILQGKVVWYTLKKRWKEIFLITIFPISLKYSNNFYNFSIIFHKNIEKQLIYNLNFPQKHIQTFLYITWNLHKNIPKNNIYIYKYISTIISSFITTKHPNSLRKEKKKKKKRIHGSWTTSTNLTSCIELSQERP